MTKPSTQKRSNSSAAAFKSGTIPDLRSNNNTQSLDAPPSIVEGFPAEPPEGGGSDGDLSSLGSWGALEREILGSDYEEKIDIMDGGGWLPLLRWKMRKGASIDTQVAYVHDCITAMKGAKKDLGVLVKKLGEQLLVLKDAWGHGSYEKNFKQRFAELDLKSAWNYMNVARFIGDSELTSLSLTEAYALAAERNRQQKGIAACIKIESTAEISPPAEGPQKILTAGDKPTADRSIPPSPHPRSKGGSSVPSSQNLGKAFEKTVSDCERQIAAMCAQFVDMRKLAEKFPGAVKQVLPPASAKIAHISEELDELASDIRALDQAVTEQLRKVADAA